MRQIGRTEDWRVDAGVFTSGLSILIAIFQELHIKSMTIAGGAAAWRLNLWYVTLAYSSLYPPTYAAKLTSTFYNWCRASKTSAPTGRDFFNQVSINCKLNQLCHNLLMSACSVHEIGLNVNFRLGPQHAAYLIRHLELPGFTPAQKKHWRVC